MIANDLKTRSYKLKLVLVSVFVLVVIAVFYVSKYYNINNDVPNSSVENYSEIDIGISVDSMYRSGMFSAYKISKQNIISLDQLPPELKLLIYKKNDQLSLRRVDFENTETGYRIEYQTRDTTIGLLKYFENLESSSWSFKKSVNTDAVALVKLGSPKFDVQVEIISADGENLKVKVDIVIK